MPNVSMMAYIPTKKPLASNRLLWSLLRPHRRGLYAGGGLDVELNDPLADSIVRLSVDACAEGSRNKLVLEGMEFEMFSSLVVRQERLT